MNNIARCGWSINPDSKLAIEEVILKIKSNNKNFKIKFAIIFATPNHNHQEIINSAYDILGKECTIIGGTAPGIFTNDYIGFGGYQVGIIGIQSESEFRTFIEIGLNESEENCGIGLSTKIFNSFGSIPTNLFLFYDSIRKTSKNGMPQLNMATPLIKGILKELPDLDSLVGCGLMADALLNEPVVQYFNHQLYEQSAIGFVNPNDLMLTNIIIHGTKPMSDYHVITKSEGNVIFEIDNKPATDAILEIIGKDANISPVDFPLFLTLGVNKGDKFEDFREDNYASRLCFAIDQELKAIIMFEPDLQVGSEIQIMRRSFDNSYVSARVKSILELIKPRQISFIFYINCLGRYSAFCGMEEEDVSEIQKILGKDIPFFGIYSGVEIAKVGKTVQALDWTGVLCIFYE